MKLKYQGSTKVRCAQLQALRREFEVLGWEKVDDYFTRTLTIAKKNASTWRKYEAECNC